MWSVTGNLGRSANPSENRDSPKLGMLRIITRHENGGVCR
jgi:hypothetical protein